MKKTLVLILGASLVSLGCEQTPRQSTGGGSTLEDTGNYSEGGPPPSGDTGTDDSGANLDAGSNTDGSSSDASMAESDGSVINNDGGISGNRCDPNFGEASACGGSAVGTWSYTEGCIDETAFGMLSAQCQGITRLNESQVTSGSFTITSTMTYRRVLNDRFQTDVKVPPLCVQFVGTCSSIEASIGLVIPGATTSCLTTTTGGCDCHVEIAKSISDQGTYTLPSPGVARLVPDDGSIAGDYYYCIDNGEFTYKGSTETAVDHSVTYILIPQ